MNQLTTGVFLERLIAPRVMWSAFLVTTSLFIIVTIILWYHWRTYALQTQTIRIVRVVYAVGGLVFVALQLIALLSL
ncbi:MAG: hypothetical protein RL681_695 [Candidatus Parcubacteria bacterium]|jgi:hypothetical protein